MEKIDFERECWAVVWTAGGRFLGRVVSDPPETVSRRIGEYIEYILCPAFEYQVRVSIAGDQIRKEPLAIPVDITTGPARLRILAPTAILLLHEASKADQEHYARFIASALGAQEVAAQEAVARNRGIILPR